MKVTNYVNECDLCGKSFTTSLILRNHIKITHQGIKNYKCMVCGISFGLHRTMKNHVRNRHSENTTQTCPFCDSNVKNLNQHILEIHNNIEKRFKCNICDKKYHKQSELQRHLKTMH